MYVALSSDQRRFVIPVVTFTLVLLGVVYYSISTSHRLRLPPPIELHRDRCVRPSTGTSRVVRGIPGFWVFEHVWFHDDSFYFFTDDGTRIPVKDRVVRGPVGFKVGPWDEDMSADKAQCMPDSTLLLTDGLEGGWNGLHHYYHFAAENLLGGVAAMGMGGGDWHGAGAVDRLAIPWREDWQDTYGMNDEVVRGLFGKNVIEAKTWRELTSRGARQQGRGWLAFERLIIVDRLVAHAHGNLAKAFNKMSMDAFAEPLVPHFFSPSRVRFAHHLRAPARHRPWPGVALAPIPKIVYVDRQGRDETEWNDRRLVTADHLALLAVLAELKKHRRATVTRARLGEMDKHAQFATMMDADVIIGVHGNGLTHAMWMPEGGVIIELFPPRSFLADYAIVADVLDHQHHVVWNDIVVSRYDWERETREGTLDNELLHNGTHIPLDSAFISALLDHTLRSLSMPPD